MSDTGPRQVQGDGPGLPRPALGGRRSVGRDAGQGSHRHQPCHPLAHARRGEGRQRGGGGQGGGGPGVRSGGGHEDAELSQ